MNELLRSSYPGIKQGRSLKLVDLDKLISAVFPKKYQRKMARVIHDVCEASDRYFSANEVSKRLIQHVDAGLYVGYGNLENWGYSEIGPVVSETT